MRGRQPRQGLAGELRSDMSNVGAALFGGSQAGSGLRRSFLADGSKFWADALGASAQNFLTNSRRFWAYWADRQIWHIDRYSGLHRNISPI